MLMKIANKTLAKLLPLYKEISLLGNIQALLGWDLNVNLPPQAAAGRAEQSGYVASKITQLWLSPEFRTLVEQSQTEKDLNQEEQAMVRNLKIGSKFFYNVPKELIIKKEQVTSAAFMVWKQAKEENDFKKFAPNLTKIMEIEKEIASHLGYKTNPYDALLDMYEPELTAKECERLFTGVKKELVPLIKKISKSKEQKKPAGFIGTTQYSLSDQEKLLKFAIGLMGFDMTRGTVSVSPHPFTTQLGQHDIRLTTMYNLTDFRESFTSAMHEAGHGLYEQGVSPEYNHTPLAGGVSLGIHEALSRFWENMVGKNPAFLSYMYPHFIAFYPDQFRMVDESSFIHAFHHIRPSLIRIHADEVTYSLHIILRFEMENALVNGKISVKDAPEAWRAKSKELFGIEPEKDSEGVLQDVHWTYGSIGYFPAYALGNLYGAQFLDTMKKTVKFEKELEKGNLLPIKHWFDKNIHTYGSLYMPAELVKKVTGKELDYTYFTKYLTDKYTSFFSLK